MPASTLSLESDKENCKPLSRNKCSPLIQKRIVEVVAANAPFDTGRLPALYKEQYHEKLDAKSLGFKKLKHLLDTIPSIECRLEKGKHILSTKQDKQRIGSKANTPHDISSAEPTTTAHTSQPAAVLPDSY